MQFRAQESVEQTSFETVGSGYEYAPPTDKSDPTEPQQLQLTAMDENVLKEQFYAQQLIDDPEGFETEICDGFLERATNEAVRG